MSKTGQRGVFHHKVSCSECKLGETGKELPMIAGTFREMMAPHLPKTQQEGEQERRKAAKKTTCLDSLPSLWPWERSCLAVWAGNAPALHGARVCWITPASTSHPLTKCFNVVLALLCYLFWTKRAGLVRQTCCEYLSWQLSISLFIFSTTMGLGGHRWLLGSSPKCFCMLD